MKRQKENTSGKLVMFSILLGIMVIFSSINVIAAPVLFLRILGTLSIIVASMAIGAFIREVFVLKEKKKPAKDKDRYSYIKKACGQGDGNENIRAKSQ